jgi:hypothetical protein
MTKIKYGTALKVGGFKAIVLAHNIMSLFVPLHWDINFVRPNHIWKRRGNDNESYS